MKTKLLSRLLCALLTVLMLVSVIPAFTLSAFAAEDEEIDYTKVAYDDALQRLESMTKYYENADYALYCDTLLGSVAYHKKSTDEVLFTNPWDIASETSLDEAVRSDLMSQIIMTYQDSLGTLRVLNSFNDAALKGQMTVKAIKNGVRVEYAIGERSARILVPRQIERKAFEEKILKPLEENLSGGKTNRIYIKLKAYFNEQFYTSDTVSETKKQAIALKYPVTQKKNIDIYVCDVNASNKQLRELESWILAYCPEYTFEEMDNDHDYVEYEEEAFSPPVFKMALEYTITARGLSVSLPANGLRYDENAYRITDLQILPYMGACKKTNEGYSFIPDGSGTLYDLDTVANTGARVYGEDYALFSNVSGFRTETVRMPVFGQVETEFYPKLITPPVVDSFTGEVIEEAVYSETEGTYESRGYLAIIEEGESLATIAPNHASYRLYSSVVPSFITRQSDVSVSGWDVYACRRYVEDYRICYIMLSDDARAEKAALSSYYECSWMGMACAYRDYLAAKDNGYQRLTAEDVETSIPLYIETFGCVDTIEKVLSMPVTVSVPLTTFEEIGKMYDYLAINGVTNVNFKLKGYANGGLYSDVPYKLKWEKSVGGASDFRDLLEKAAADGFGIYPDFDFVYTTMSDGGSKVNMKKHASRTIDNRYTSKRVYSATQQSLVSYYQMVLSPVTYSRFYEKLEKKYSRYENNGISLSTFGSALNSDYDEDKTTLREEAKTYVMEALSYFRDKDYDIMLEGGNAYTWNYANHILNVSLDSSRYNAELSAVPFMGVVLHGYTQFAGSALNMEGNLRYAMLKAMENGASAYFVLSYANTELLKEDELLSQNYSVRYDIWQKRLVDIYVELNNVLHDVQTKLIVGHEHLDATRVPDEDELLRDIADAAAEQAAAVAAKIEADRLAKVQALRKAVDATANSVNSISRGLSNVNVLFSRETGMLSQLASGTNTSLLTPWNALLDEIDQNGAATPDAKANLSDAFYTYVVSAIIGIRTYKKDAGAALVAAKEGYSYLVSVNANQQLIDQAYNNLSECIDTYVELLNVCGGQNTTITAGNIQAYINGTESSLAAFEALLVVGAEQSVDAADLEAFIFGNDATVNSKYQNIGTEAVYTAFLAALEAQGLYNPADSANSTIDIEALIAKYYVGSVVEDEEEEEDTGAGTPGVEDEDVVVPDPPKSKYSVDNNVVAVTYGDSADTPYKSLLLNFNDYTVQTTWNGVTYTLAGYGYLVIMHQ